MTEFLKFMVGGYWSDADSNAVGGRGTLLFCWVMTIIFIASLALMLLAVIH